MDFASLNLQPKEMANYFDDKDELKYTRDLFTIPKNSTITKDTFVEPNDDCVYLCTNSLGLMPKSTRGYLNQDLDKWANRGVLGQLQGEEMWSKCEDLVDQDMADIVGAERNEVTIANGLTVNEHLLMISFYNPKGKRNKILLEHKAFPSDHYCAESQIRLHNLNPEDCLVFVRPREGEFFLRTEDIVDTIRRHGDTIATILLPGVQYLTGQLLDMQTITQIGHEMGCLVGFDLAHAVGNVMLHLHDWNVDFACWCTYKYLSAGPGSLGGLYIHSSHHHRLESSRNAESSSQSSFKILKGWWSHKWNTRFIMDNVMESRPGAKAYLLSNTPVLYISTLRASLEIFKQVGMKALVEKSKLLTGFLDYLIQAMRPSDKDKFDIMIVTDKSRGCQLSLMFRHIQHIHKLHDYLERRGFVIDKREPSTLRVSPFPLINSFQDVYKFVSTVFEALSQEYID